MDNKLLIYREAAQNIKHAILLPYKILIPLIDGVQQIVAENTEPVEENK